MPFNPIAGPKGAVLVNSVSFALGKWRASIKSGLPKVNNFTSGFQILVGGLISATLTMDGPYDGGNMPLSAGNSYTFTLQYTPAIVLTVTALVESIDPSQDIEDAARVSITAQSSGSFTPSIV